jgi:hypothetical protein
MIPKCEHILADIDIDTGKPTYTYCTAHAACAVSGVLYCPNHALENERREKIMGLISQIDANRPQS